MSDSSATFSRRRDLDIARECVVGSLIFFHTARIFDDFPWFFPAAPSTGLFQPAHLWFLYVLLVFTFLLLPIFL
jgi:hypothetical protein